MKSTSGEYYVGLDHVRAIAALLVFVWHFIHGANGVPVPFPFAPAWSPLVLFDEGHVGVALFMALSGYLFSKLLDGKRVDYRWFFWNRLLRLMPLLIVVFIINALIASVHSGDVHTFFSYFAELPQGFVYPTWPNGGWSITIELHFYLLLPIILLLQRRWQPALFLVVACALAIRSWYWTSHAEVQSLAYWTIFGRIDQFMAGIIAYRYRSLFIGRHALMVGVAAAFITLYWWFDMRGGFYFMPAYPSPSPLWIVLPTLEGTAFAVFIAWYDGSFQRHSGIVSDVLRRLGEYSYSIYLLHFFFVFAAARWLHEHVLDLSNFYVACGVAVIAFVAMLPIGYLSMRFVEKPFLRLRRRYVIE